MSDPVRGFGNVLLRNQIAHLDVVRKCWTAVREPLGDVQLASVLRGKFEVLPAAECRRVRPEVDDDIPDLALHAPDQFHLGMRLALKVHATQGATPRRHRNAVLGKAGLESVGREFV